MYFIPASNGAELLNELSDFYKYLTNAVWLLRENLFYVNNGSEIRGYVFKIFSSVLKK